MCRVRSFSSLQQQLQHNASCCHGEFCTSSSSSVIAFAALWRRNKLSEGVFIGVFLSMSSTAVVLKFLTGSPGLCCVLLFALLPILGGTSQLFEGIISMTKVLVILSTFMTILLILTRACIPWFMNLMISLSSKTNELYPLAAVAFSLLVAWCSEKLGLSLELGSIVAGVMISTTDHGQHSLERGKLYMLVVGTTAISLLFLRVKRRSIDIRDARTR